MKLTANFKALLMVSLVTFFVACTKPNQQSDPKSGDPTTTIGVPNNTDKGTADGGGGNTCQGRPLESYAFNVVKSKAYMNYIEPVISELTARQDDMFRLVTYAALKKNWYVLPCELSKLPAEKTGSAVATEQAALQTFGEVWLNDKIFNAMSEKDQADLIMHEMLMGFRLLKFDSSYAQCRAFAPRLDYCDQNLKTPRGKPSDLTEQDYKDIRRTTVEIFTFPPKASQVDWEDFFAVRNFGNDFKFLRRKIDNEVLQPAEFLKRIQEASLTGHTPTYGISTENDFSVRKKEICSVQLNVESNSNRIDLKVKRATGAEFHHVIILNGPVHLHSIKEGERILKSTFGMFDESSNFKLGEKKPTTVIYFDGSSRIAKVEVSETVCVDTQVVNGKDQCKSWSSPKNRYYYTCSDIELETPGT